MAIFLRRQNDRNSVNYYYFLLFQIFTDVKQYTIQGLAKMIRKSQNTKTFQLNVISILEGLNFSKEKKDKVETNKTLQHLTYRCSAERSVEVY